MLLDGLDNNNQACNQDVAMLVLAEMVKTGLVAFDTEHVARIRQHLIDDPTKVPQTLLDKGRYDALWSMQEQTADTGFQTPDDLNGMVKLGDTCLVKDLTSAQGRSLNGYFGKVIAEQNGGGRWGIRINDRTYALK